MLAIEPCTIQHLEALLVSPDTFRQSFGLELADDYDLAPRELQQSLFRLKHRSMLPRWGHHLVVLDGERLVVGMGGYAGNPDDDGIVEVGCSIAPSYRGRGLGTKAVQTLVARALGSGDVRCVRVRSRSNPAAPGGALRALGLEPVAEERDADGMPLWRWELRRSSGEPRK
jgi:RimJ/RimL family protein N-acetyltransferase